MNATKTTRFGKALTILNTLACVACLVTGQWWTAAACGAAVGLSVRL